MFADSSEAARGGSELVPQLLLIPLLLAPLSVVAPPLLFVSPVTGELEGLGIRSAT